MPKVKLSEREHKVLKTLFEFGDEACFYTRYIAKESKMPQVQVRRSVRALVRKGLAALHRGLINEETGMLAGSGYCITRAGIGLIEAEEKDEEIKNSQGSLL